MVPHAYFVFKVILQIVHIVQTLAQFDLDVPAIYILGCLVNSSNGIFHNKTGYPNIYFFKFAHILSINAFLLDTKVQMCKRDTVFLLYFENVQY